MKTVYPAVLRPEPEGGYTILYPDLDGCISYGEDLKEALEMSQEALGLYLVSLEERKIDVPAASDVKAIKADEDSIVTPIMIEVNKYRRNKTVNKTLTLPAWLNEAGEKAHVNFSGILQEALKQKLGY
ncbi:MAG: type II toxin-antitoxin system HicB family antitoxin [Clostridiales bacterium]|jgi:predicted RNase H-like HicB family nuclease|nr:type II toxin-antitoxin system HicB family antitoxin [Clostridiales bacterium]MDR2711864.1 type II toxin-antitoxin system HicB family antitoxin [Clostridiales bacterium]